MPGPCGIFCLRKCSTRPADQGLILELRSVEESGSAQGLCAAIAFWPPKQTLGHMTDPRWSHPVSWADGLWDPLSRKEKNAGISWISILDCWSHSVPCDCCPIVSPRGWAHKKTSWNANLACKKGDIVGISWEPTKSSPFRTRQRPLKKPWFSRPKRKCGYC